MKYKQYLTEARKMSNEEINELIDEEGLGYAIQSSLSWKNIEDPKLAKAWREASDAMSKVENILGR